jgi:hypothetical protein
MNGTASKAKGWTIALWAAQLLLAAAYGLFGSMKAMQPLDQLAVMMKWIPDFPPLFVRTLGIVEVLAAVGLILPSVTRIQPRLTVLAALCIMVHQFCAVALHVSRGEVGVVGLNIVLIALAGFIFWGRQNRAVVAPRG